MTNLQIADLLRENESKLKAIFDSQESKFWEVKPKDKWSAGQHVIHLVQSSEPLLKALKLPNFLLKWRYGTSNRPVEKVRQQLDIWQEK